MSAALHVSSQRRQRVELRHVDVDVAQIAVHARDRVVVRVTVRRLNKQLFWKRGVGVRNGSLAVLHFEVS